MASRMPVNQSGATAALLLGVSMSFMKKLTALMRQSAPDLDPTQGGVLARIGEGPCRMSDLAQHQCVRLPTISRSVSSLVKRGLVERWVPENDRRITMVGLTDEGRRLVDTLMRAAQANTESLLHGLSGREHDMVQEALSVLDRVLSPSKETDS